MAYLLFFRAHRALLSFGLLAAFSTSFGQTFFISLFLPSFERDFQLGKSGFGFLYGLATLASALLLPVIGGAIDRADLRRYTTGTLAGLTLSALGLALAPNVLVFAAGLLGLRLFGQGILGHISQTVMARDFSSDRGKALGVAGIGYPLGEGFLPIIFALLLRGIDWRWVWLGVAVFVGGVLFPIMLRLLAGHAPVLPHEDSPGYQPASSFDRMQLYRDRRIYLVMPSVLVLPFVLTGIFLYQAALVQAKGWSLEWIAGAFSAFALTRALSSLAIGPLIDRFSATRILPVYMLPLTVGLIVAATAASPWYAFVYMVLAGLTAGASGSVASAVWAELYGGENVGRVRSLASAFAVVAAAASPPLMGWLFTVGVTLPQMLAGAAGLVILASLISVLLRISGLVK